MTEPSEPAHRPSSDGTADVLAFPSTGRSDTSKPVDPTPRLRDLIGDVLRDERHAQERTLAEIAERAAVSLPYLSEVERGTKEVSSDVLAAICDALELPLDVLLERSVDRLRPHARGGSGTFMLAA